MVAELLREQAHAFAGGGGDFRAVAQRLRRVLRSLQHLGPCRFSPRLVEPCMQSGGAHDRFPDPESGVLGGKYLDSL